jgi:glycosyltransferase involved in cell wall biosynthesis
LTIDVSVLIPCYNARPWIAETLRSVGVAGSASVEIIVVDDGSTDGGPDLIADEFPWVRLLRTPNSGPSRARNIATSIAVGTFIQYLDADDLLANGKLDAQIRALNETGADVAYGDWQRLATDTRGRAAPGEIVCRVMTRAPELELFGDLWCPPAAYLFRRSMVDRVGGWNERLPIIQDVRFVLDCALSGATFVYTPGVQAFYRVHTSGSVSTRDPQAFNRDHFVNALDVQAWWQTHGGVTQDRQAALVFVLAYVARQAFHRDETTFRAALKILHQLEGRYIPKGNAGLRVASTLFGYVRAEQIAWWYKRARRLTQDLALVRRLPTAARRIAPPQKRRAV